MVIKAVVLDFGGTLADGDIDWEDYHDAILSLLGDLGFDVDRARLRRAISDALEALERARSREAEMTLEEVYAHALHKIGIRPEEDLLKAIHDLFRAHFKTTLHPCAEAVLQELSKRYRLAILSNTISDTPRVFLQRTGLIRYFEVVVCSRDLGVRKPNPRAFHHVLDRLGVEPSEAVHVGDGVDTDMEGASRVGMKAVWIRGPEASGWTGPAIQNLCELPEYLSRLDSCES